MSLLHVANQLCITQYVKRRFSRNLITTYLQRNPQKGLQEHFRVSDRNGLLCSNQIDFSTYLAWVRGAQGPGAWLVISSSGRSGVFKPEERGIRGEEV